MDTSNKWTHFYLQQRCPPISIYSSLISCGTHVSVWHMCLTGWDLILFLLYFSFEYGISNEWPLLPWKSRYILDKVSQMTDMIQLQNQQFSNETLHERKFSTELLVFSKCVLKNFANFLFFSGFCRISKNTFLLEHSWASASEIISDIFKSNKYMKVSFLLTVFYRKK